MKIFVSLVLFLSSFAPTFGAEADPVVVKAIADALDSLVGDTVDEGSWDANVIRDVNGNPTDADCRVKTAKKGEEYICNITFLITPYEGEDLDSETWQSTCDDVTYFVTSKKGVKIVLKRDESSVTACLETLNEGP